MISIIVPVYNAEATIERCVRSIQEQTEKDIEIILVNDGSADRSLEIMEDLALGNPNIKIINKKNGGVSSARNEGLNITKGEYIAFIDSDDYYLDQNYLKKMLSIFLTDITCDLVISGYTIISSNERKVITGKPCSLPTHKVAEEYLNLREKGLLNSLWNKMYKCEIIDKIRFIEEMSFGEDAVFVTDYLKQTKKVIFIDNPGYGYIFQNISTTSSFRNDLMINPYQTNIYHMHVFDFWNSFLDRNLAITYFILLRTSMHKTIVRRLLLNKQLTKVFFSSKYDHVFYDPLLKPFVQFLSNYKGTICSKETVYTALLLSKNKIKLVKVFSVYKAITHYLLENK